MVWIGLTTFRTREIKRNRLFMLPLLILVLGLIGVLNESTSLTYAALGALIGLLVGVIIGWRLAASRPGLRAHPQHSALVVRPGSFLTLGLLLAAVVIKLVVSLVMSRNPVLPNSISANLVSGLIDGVLIGLFWGVVLNQLARLRKNPSGT